MVGLMRLSIVHLLVYLISSNCIAVNSSQPRRNEQSLRLDDRRLNENEIIPQSQPSVVEEKLPESKYKRIESDINSFIESITPFSIYVIVNVTKPSSIWCSAIKSGDVLDEHDIIINNRGEEVKSSKSISIMKLSPNTEYDVYCFCTNSDSKQRELFFSKKLNALTGDAFFNIVNIHRNRRSISYRIHSNMDAFFVCYLLNRKPEVISTVEITSSSSRIVRFDMLDKRKPFMTKCEMYDKTNTMMMSTSVEDIAGKKSFISILLPYSIILMLIMIIRFIWRNMKRFDPTTTIAGTEKGEEIGLLKNMTDSAQLVTGHTHDVDLLDEKKTKILCIRCGFVNSKASTVCKECNTLLNGSELFIPKKEMQYY